MIDSNLSEQKQIPFKACRSSFEADFVLFLEDDDDDDGVCSIVSELDRENSLGG